MKIGLVVPGGVDSSGTHRVIPHLVERLERLTTRHEVHVFALRQEVRPGRWTLKGAAVRNIGIPPRTVRAIAAVVREHGRSPFDVLHAMFLPQQGIVAGVAGRTLGVPVVMEAPGGEFVSIPEIGYGALQRRRGRLAVGWSVRRADRLLVPSEPARLLAIAHGVEAERVPWGVDRDFWAVREPRRRSVAAPLRIAWVASLNEVKDPWTMVAVARRLEGMGLTFVLDVVGEDTLSGRVQEAVVAGGLGGRVRCHGFLPPPGVRALLMEQDVLLLTSRFEGGPRVVLEAGALGVPTVGTDVGYVSEMAADGAVAAPVGDSLELAMAVASLARDEDRRLRLGSTARGRVLAEDLHTVVSRLERIYEELVTSRRRPGANRLSRPPSAIPGLTDRPTTREGSHDAGGDITVHRPSE